MRLDETNNNNQVSELQGEIQSLKKSLKRKQNRKILSCGNCLIVFIVIILILGFLTAYGLALSGLVTVPFFSARYYKEAKPTYQVVIDESIKESDILNNFKQVVYQESLKQKSIENLKVNFVLTDKQLTALIKDKIKANEDLNKSIESGQVAVLPDNVEVFLKMKDLSRAIFTLNLLPKIINNKLDLEVIEFKIGALRLPKFIGNMTVVFIGEKSLNQVLNLLEKNGQIQNIKIEQGLINIEILINNIKGLI